MGFAPDTRERTTCPPTNTFEEVTEIFVVDRDDVTERVGGTEGEGGVLSADVDLERVPGRSDDPGVEGSAVEVASEVADGLAGALAPKCREPAAVAEGGAREPEYRYR